jgi:GAF domain-containing protein
LIDSRPAGVVLAGHPDPGAFGEDEIGIAYIVARHASIAVTRARHEETLAEAVDARKLVGQAMGILMERYDLDADRAFAVLARYSQHTNTKLRNVALRLIETRTLPGLANQEETQSSTTAPAADYAE